ncbi:putative mycothiol-dependent maleylpyruvate isomerase [Kutzneria albida DSM 43870]|nr:putative mycothiol-dependent maleylpyruvate isomerase [Kutzneria albida DSM 43870]
MVGNSGAQTHTTKVTVPQQRAELSDAVRDAAAGLGAAERATASLLELVESMDDASARAASALPGWTRGHVLSHLARNADGLVNLLTWARTGVEHPMYTSRADRDTAIEEGAPRSLWLLREDLLAACGRFGAAATGLGEAAWQAEVLHGSGRAIPAHHVPWLRVQELWVHMVDLDLGIDFAQFPADVVERLIHLVLPHYAGRTDMPALRLEVQIATGRQVVWEVAGSGESHVVRGSGTTMLAWLTGRGGAGELAGDVPELPAWL